MQWWEAGLLGALQGLTEWLPISSSGHLILGEELMGIDPPVAYLLLLHVATLAAVIWVYRARLGAMLGHTVSLPRDLAQGVPWREAWTKDPDRMLALWVVLGTVPVVVVGLLLKEWIEASHDGMGMLWFDFTVSALLLVRASLRKGTTRPMSSMRALDALVIGAYQVLSLLPGVSRSGATLAGAVERRFGWAEAADYSFLLSIPALTGAMVLEWRSFGDLAEVGWTASIVGFAVSLVVGYATIRFLLAFLRRQKPWAFAAYCAVLALFTAWYSLTHP